MLTRRLRTLLSWICALALISQLLLPVTHALLLARDAVHPLSTGFCGQLDAARIARLQARLLAQLQAALSLRRDDPGQPSCPTCAAVHAAQVAAPPALGVLQLSLVYAIADAVRTTASPAVCLVRLPPLRGPPYQA